MAGRPLLSRFDSRVSRLAGPVAWTLALWTALTTVVAVIAASSDLPYADEWDTWRTWLKQGYSLGWFFAQHADHRIATTRLLFAIDNWAFGGRVWFPQAVSFAVQASLVLLLWRLAKRSGVTDSEDGRVLGGAIACCLFSAQQLINFTWGFQVQFFLVYGSGAAALWALLRATEAAHAAGRRAWIAASLLLAAVCSYSMANGVLIWPILLLAAVRLRAGRAAVALLGVGSVLVFGQYFHGWHTSGLDAPAPPWRVVLFAMANAGSPSAPLAGALGGSTSGVGFAAMVAGGLLLAFAAVQWVQVWARSARYSAARVVLSHFTVFVAAALFAIAAGRAHLPLVAAFRARYMTPAYILWACLLSVAWPGLSALNPRRVRWVALLALLLGIAWYQVSEIRGAREDGVEANRASASIAVGVNDPELVPMLNYTFADLAPVVRYLKEHRLSIFRQEWTEWPGQPLAPRFSVGREATACHGGIRAMTPVSDPAGPGWRVSGWARYASGGAPDRIVLADGSGHISGVALADSGEWDGYARAGPPSVTAYAVEPDGKSLCRLGTWLPAAR